MFEPEPFVGHEAYELRTNQDLFGWVETATSIHLGRFLVMGGPMHENKCKHENSKPAPTLVRFKQLHIISCATHRRERCVTIPLQKVYGRRLRAKIQLPMHNQRRFAHSSSRWSSVSTGLFGPHDAFQSDLNSMERTSSEREAAADEDSRLAKARCVCVL